MEQYLEAGEMAPEKLLGVVGKAIATGSVVPILFTAARTEIGVRELLDFIADYCPSPIEGKQRVAVRGETQTPIKPDPKAPFVGQVFKVFADPRSNIKFSVCRILSGAIKSDASIHVGEERKPVRPGQLYKLQGVEHVEIPEGIAGDIVALAKLDTKIGVALHAGDCGTIEMPPFPHPMFSLSIEPKSRNGRRQSQRLARQVHRRGPLLRAERDPSTKELVIRGIGDLHLRTILSRMAAYFKLEVDTKPPKIPYRENDHGLGQGRRVHAQETDRRRRTVRPGHHRHGAQRTRQGLRVRR